MGFEPMNSSLKGRVGSSHQSAPVRLWRVSTSSTPPPSARNRPQSHRWLPEWLPKPRAVPSRSCNRRERACRRHHRGPRRPSPTSQTLWHERRGRAPGEPVAGRLAASPASEVMYGRALPRREATRLPPCGASSPGWAQYPPRPLTASVGHRVGALGTTGWGEWHKGEGAAARPRAAIDAGPR